MDEVCAPFKDRRRLARKSAGHDPAYWPFVVVELEACYQAQVLVRGNRALGVRLLWLRSEGFLWSEVLAALREPEAP